MTSLLTVIGPSRDTKRAETNPLPSLLAEWATLPSLSHLGADSVGQESTKHRFPGTGQRLWPRER